MNILYQQFFVNNFLAAKEQKDKKNQEAFGMNQLLDQFYTVGFLLYPLKISENLCFSDLFRGYRITPLT